MKIQSVAVFCGSQEGKNPAYGEQAKELGKMIGGLGMNRFSFSTRTASTTR